MLVLTMTNDSDIALKFKVTIRILIIFGWIIVLIIRIWPNTKDPLFGTALVSTAESEIQDILRAHTVIDFLYNE